MAIVHMEHVGVIVEDLPAAIEFFVALGLELEEEQSVEGEWVDRVVGLKGVRSDIAMLQTPGGHTKLELARFRSPAYEGDSGPAPSNAPGIRHILFAVDDIDTAVASVRERGFDLVGEVESYRDIYKLCYVRGPEGIIIELAEKIG